MASEWFHPYSARVAPYRTPSRTTSVSGVPIFRNRIVSLAIRPTSTSPMASSRLANSCGAIVSGAGSVTSTNT
ncbi:MAG TPA: hypothetical protein VF482_11855 [Trebonia sp.]